MKSDTLAQILASLGIDQSFSRPHVSDDNPFSESGFKTLKYQPDYPGFFAGLLHARAWLSTFFGWPNDEHQHSGLALFHACRGVLWSPAGSALRTPGGARRGVRFPPRALAQRPTTGRFCRLPACISTLSKPWPSPSAAPRPSRTPTTPASPQRVQPRVRLAAAKTPRRGREAPATAALPS
jgi:hypothetical protein